MLALTICLLAAIALCWYLASLLTAVDYNSYIREMKLRIPEAEGNPPAVGAGPFPYQTSSLFSEVLPSGAAPKGFLIPSVGSRKS